jgi:hypothetical protein
VNGDPMQDLQAFYEECRVAPVPGRLLAPQAPLPFWKRVFIPLTGLSFGGFVALLVLAFPAHPSTQLGAQVARSLSESQLRTRPESRVTEHAKHGRVNPWNA